MTPSQSQSLILLKESLSEAQDSVRAFDTKAQIVGVGYIFSLGVVGQVGNLIETDAPHVNVWTILISWVFVIVPILLFGYVLYPTRKSASRFQFEATRSSKHILFYDPASSRTVEDLREAVLHCDPLDEVAYELLRTAKLRDMKRKRFLRALFAAGLAFVVLFAGQVGTVLYG